MQTNTVPEAKFHVTVNEPELKALRRALRDYDKSLALVQGTADKGAWGALYTERQLILRLIDRAGK